MSIYCQQLIYIVVLKLRYVMFQNPSSFNSSDMFSMFLTEIFKCPLKELSVTEVLNHSEGIMKDFWYMIKPKLTYC